MSVALNEVGISTLSAVISFSFIIIQLGSCFFHVTEYSSIMSVVMYTSGNNSFNFVSKPKRVIELKTLLSRIIILSFLQSVT